ncbi:MAG TPA: adenylate/guanylate cyclase domain-containing protein, partial [Acidimicrobiia bacterium]
MVDRVVGLDPYVPRVASEWDLHAPGSLWRAITGSLVFVDISGFTNLSERLARRGRIGAEELTGVLNRVFGHMLEIVFQRGGSLLKFGGDALLLLFDTDDHVMQACAATVEMRSALREASREKTSVGRINLKMSSGIHTGPIDFFLVGDSHRELLVTGPTASVTTEMEGTADAGEIVVSHVVKEALPADFTGDAKGNGWLLRKQKIAQPECGPVVREFGDEPDLTVYVPRRLREQLQSGIGDSEHRIATIGFLKYKGIDALLSADGAESVGKKLDELVKVVQAAVDAEDITFLASDIDADGGKIILAAGVPASQHDDEGRMLRAARQILDSELDLSARMGLNRGHVFAGDVGSNFRRTFTVMGDTVNLAARLMAAAGPGALYSSPAVLDEASTLFRTEALEPFHVKGKDEPVRAYQVFEEIGVRPPELSHDLPFHGREAEVDMLVSIITTCARVGRGGMMTVSGETGIGKTRLIAEVLERCPGLATLMIKAEPNGSTNPYWAFRDPMRRKLGIERADTETMSKALEKAVETLAPGVLTLVPLLGDVLHIDIPDNETTSAIDPRFRPDRTADAVVDLLTALHNEPFAIITEDGQWLDDASTNLLRRIGTAAETRPWTTIVTIRESEEIDHEKFGDEIGLAPLDDETIRQIANEVTAGAPLRPHELNNIVTRVGGNPLFLSEILSVIRETGNADDIPDSLDAVVSTQIDSLPPLARQTLRYSSVLGTSFPIDVLDRYLAIDEMEIDKATQAELSRFLDRDGETRLRFKHAVVHGVAYRGLPYRRRRELHERAGEVVERMNSKNPNVSAEFLAYHYSEAGRHEKAWRFSQVAAEKAKAAYANTEAATHYERALDAARFVPDADPEEMAQAWVRLGEVRELAGQMEIAREALSRALKVKGDDPITKADLLLRRAGTWMNSGNLTQAKRNVSLGQRAVDPLDDETANRIKARLDAFESSVHAARGDPVRAADAAHEAIERAENAAAEEALARAYSVLDWANFMMGVQEERHGPRAIEIYQRLGLLERSVGVMNNLGAFAYFEGNWDQAVDWYQQSLEAAERSGNVLEAALTRTNIAEVRIGQRRFDEASRLLQEARRVYEASKADHYLPLVSLLQCRLDLAEGPDESTVATLRALLESQLQTTGAQWVNETAVALGDALIAVGMTEEALELVDSRTVPNSPGLARVKIKASIELGKDAELDDLVHEAVSAAQESGDLLEELHVRELEIESARDSGIEPDQEVIDRANALRDQLGVIDDHPEHLVS